MKRSVFLASLLSLASSVSATPEYPKLQFAWETTKALAADVKVASQPFVNKASEIATELKQNPTINFLSGLFVSSVASKIVDEIVRSHNNQTRVQLESLKLHLNFYNFRTFASSRQYILDMDLPLGSGSDEYIHALYALKLQLKNPVNPEALDLTREDLAWVVEKELRGLQGWLPTLTFVGGVATSALVAAHKAGVLPKISIQFSK